MAKSKARYLADVLQGDGSLVFSGDLSVPTTFTIDPLPSGAGGSVTIGGDLVSTGGLGNASLENSSITINSYNTALGGTVTLVTDDVLEGGSPTNLYYTDARSRASISLTDTGGDGSLTYDSGTGAFTFTGPSAAETRAHFTAGTGVSIATGEIAIGQPVATTDAVTFSSVTGTGSSSFDTLTVTTTATVPYDNTISGLTATNVQSAITELNTLLGGGNIGSQATWNVYEFTTAGNDTSFDISTQGSPSPSYVPGYVKVYLNGLLLSESDYTAVDGTTVNFSPAITNAGQLVSVVVLDSFNTAELLRVTSIDASAATNTLTIDSSSNVGIGTPSPGRKLHLKDGQIKFQNTGSAGWAGLDFSMGNGTYDGYMGMLDSDGKFFIDVDSNGNDFVILQNGNVGIGTDSPNYTLDILGSHTVYAGNVATSSTLTTSYNVIRFTQGAGSGAPTGMIGTGGSATANPGFAGAFAVGTQNSAPLTFLTSDTERMRITSTGEIVTGGLTSSTGQLHLYKADATGGKLVLQSQVASDATAKITMMSRLLDNTNKNAYIEAYRGNINFSGDAGYGKVGIGTATPATALDVAGTITATGGNSTEWNNAYSVSRKTYTITPPGTTTTFYPIVLTSPDNNTYTHHFTLGEAGESAADPYNMNVLEGWHRGSGWSDVPPGWQMHYSAYDPSEKTILGVYRTVADGYATIIYVRGGEIYTITTSSTPTLYSTGWIEGTGPNDVVAMLKDDTGADIPAQADVSQNISLNIDTFNDGPGIYESHSYYHQGATFDGNVGISTGKNLELQTTSGVARGYISAQELNTGGTHAAGLIIATSSGESITFKDNNIGGTTNMVIKGDGNVGIGSTSPSDRLVVQKDSANIEPILVLKNDNTTDDNGASIDFSGKDTSGNNILYGRITAKYTNHATEKSHMIFTHRNDSGTFSEWMRVTHDGNVGIGTDTPGATNLHIGAQEVTPGGTAGTVDRLHIQPYSNTGGPYKFIARSVSGSSDFLDMYYGSTHIISYGLDGKVGIGTSTPDWALDVRGPNSGVQLQLGRSVGGSLGTAWLGADGTGFHIGPGTYSSGGFTVASPALKILATSGNVGIGTATPATALDVTGTITQNTVSRQAIAFSIPANVARKVKLTIANYDAFKVTLSAQRSNAGNSIVWWEGYINNNDNVGYANVISSQTVGGNISYTFTNNNNGIFEWDFNSSASIGGGTVIIESAGLNLNANLATYSNV